MKAAVLIGGFYDLREIPNLKSRILNLESRTFEFRISRRGFADHTRHGDMPAAMIVHGAADREAPRREANRFCDAMSQSGGHCQYVEVDGAIHRAENWTPGQWGYKDTALSR